MASHNKKVKLKVRVNKKKNASKSVEERTIGGEEFIKDFDEKVDYYVEEYVEKIERSKQLTLISGVVFFMLLIVSLYAFSVKSQIADIASSSSSENINSFGDLKNNVDEMIGNFKEIKKSINDGIEEIKETEVKKEEPVLPETQDIKPEDESIKILKEKLLENNN